MQFELRQFEFEFTRVLKLCMHIFSIFQATSKPLYCGFPSSCNAKRHALYKYVRAQLFSNRFFSVENSQEFRHAYAYNSTATEHCTRCKCSLHNCAYTHYISAWRFALQKLGKPRYRDFQVGWQSCWLRMARITVNSFTYCYDSSGIRSTCTHNQPENLCTANCRVLATLNVKRMRT